MSHTPVQPDHHSTIPLNDGVAPFEATPDQVANSSATLASTGLLARIFGAPARLRPADLLTPDHPIKPAPPARRKLRFNPGLRALFFIGLFFGSSIVLGMIFGLIWIVTGNDPAQAASVADSPWASVATIPLALLWYLLLARGIERRRPVYELAPARGLRETLVGLGLGTVFMLVSAGILALIGVYRITGFNPGYSPWAMLLTAGLTAGIVEELLFRGILFRLVEDLLGTWASVGISALVFGLVHVSNPEGTWLGGIGIALEAGMLFAALYAWTRSLWLVMGLHFAWNMVQGPVLGIVVSGTAEQGDGFVRSTMTGPEWLSGGAFGIEASIVPIVLLTALAVWLLVQLGRQGLAIKPSWVRRRAQLAMLPPTPPSSDWGPQHLQTDGHEPQSAAALGAGASN